MASLLRRPIVRVLLIVGVVAVVVGLFVFEPWKLVVDQQVDEAAPVATAPAAPQQQQRGGQPAEQGVLVLASGELISHEHASSGSVSVLRLPDGSRVLRLENLDTSNGPKLKVWLADAPVLEGTDGWYVFDDGKHVDLGDLKGNKGSSNYPIPADVDLTELSSVSIWCDRFSVSFAAAALAPVGA
ncbi:DM13 domain-containing protein [Pseudonocardia sp. TRM90224]|uniref:DM13 domain-containing protein n=1 Tax=Pseudonocardia sp. TRM90224 TaxID=2812678 RepID=UPI001E55A580|nr:DM13 domain-containing protein [Pseudonocardia sp. TRM90224]